ncbi:phage major capsid protein [Paralimibaculum aggregatum]|uniref:Phage major capsid protein n=1 Tax=Paralimibaculum aggregatum TaxID=3036245 RepID=A0ABQ6LH20_9RHOB|nr:phage major capsid protein [Limibaculum sp. NKW23]GMG82592.1 phage major capsid protein [Limibaculum sp. NKW23]
MADPKELREKRAQIVAQARSIVDQAEAEKREMTDEERGNFTRAMEEAEKVGRQIEQEERLRELERESALREAETGAETRGKPQGTQAEQRQRAWETYLRTGRIGAGLEVRDLQAEDGPSGGFITAPQQFVNTLIKAVDDEVFIRRLATTEQLGMAGSLGAPELVADPSDAEWTTELGTGSNDTAMKFGKREIYPHPFAKRIKISKDILRKSTIGIEALVRQRFAYKFGVTEEKAFINGTGQRQPLGLMTASNDGIPASRDVATDNSQTEITADGLINAKFSLKAQYLSRAVWIFHRDAVKQLAKLKDGEGQYLWRTGLTGSDPDTLLGRPIYMSEYMPSTFTTGKRVGLFGDLSHYWIADALDMQMQRLDELYAEANQVGFIARRETDGAPVLAEAFARVKLA